jgi:hypothetical protein
MVHLHPGVPVLAVVALTTTATGHAMQLDEPWIGWQRQRPTGSLSLDHPLTGSVRCMDHAQHVGLWYALNIPLAHRAHQLVLAYLYTPTDPTVTRYVVGIPVVTVGTHPLYTQRVCALILQR